MKLGVLGNCQAGGFADSIKALVPGCELVAVRLDTMAGPEQRTPELLDHHARLLESCDVVFSHNVEVRLGPLATEALTPRVRRLILIPTIGFDGLQPDCVYVRETNGTQLRAAMGPYHSALAFGCFAAGLPAERAIRLFNLHSYAALDYLDAYPDGIAALAGQWNACGFDLQRALSAAPPVCMHTVNHPCIALLFALAQQAMDQAGIAYIGQAAMPSDRLANSIAWPVYPEIGRPLGIVGDLVFRPNAGAAHDLRTVIEASYSAFAGTKSFRTSPGIIRAVNFIRQEVLGKPPHPLLLPAGPEDVRAAYRMILGRDVGPEQAGTLAEGRILVGDLRRGLLKSKEFQTVLAALG
jgi:hypothetical protein